MPESFLTLPRWCLEIVAAYAVLGFGLRGGYRDWPAWLQSLWKCLFPLHALALALARAARSWGPRGRSVFREPLGTLRWIWSIVWSPWTWLLGCLLWRWCTGSWPWEWCSSM